MKANQYKIKSITFNLYAKKKKNDKIILGDR